MNRLFKHAFTLIELLAVIAIIGILSGLIVVSMGGMTQKATIAKSQVFSNSLKNALMLNLISEWKFDELTTAVDSAAILDSWSGGNNNGFLDINLVAADTSDKLRTDNCVSGKCLFFDGTDDYVYVIGSELATSNLAITGAITLATWVKFITAGTATAIIGRGAGLAGNNNYGYSLTRNGTNNQIYFDTYSTTTRDALISSSAIVDDSWHYVVGTWDGTTNVNGKKIYIDATLDNQKTSAISIIGQPAYTFRMGRGGTGLYPLNGLLDEVRIYNTSIPTSQIKEQYYVGLNKLLASGQVSVGEYQDNILKLSQYSANK